MAITDDLTTEITYIGVRTDPPASMGQRKWEHHLYHVSLELDDRHFEFDYRVGTGWFREAEDAWNGRRTLALPDYLAKGPQTPGPNGEARFTEAKRKRFREERDQQVIRGALASIASDITMFEDYTDDDLAAEFEMRPSQIAKARAHVAEAREFLGHRVEAFITAYRED